MKTLDNDELAEFYKKKTGNSPYSRSIDDVYDWATKQKEIIVNSDTSLSLLN